MGCSKNYIMYWGVFTLIIVPFSHSKVCTNFQKKSHSFYSICIVHKFHGENTTYFLHKRIAFLGFYFGLTIFLLFSSPVTFPHYSRNKECALAHSRACGGRLRHLPYTPQRASPWSGFCFTGKQFPVKQKKDSHRSAALLRRRYFYYGV